MLHLLHGIIVSCILQQVKASAFDVYSQWFLSLCCAQEDIVDQMLKLLAADISAHSHQLQLLGMASLKLRLLFEKAVKEQTTNPNPNPNPKSKVEKVALTKEQKSIYLFRYGM